MTPYHTPHHNTQTPRYGGQTPGTMGPPAPLFVHPGALTPGHRTPSHRSTPTPTPPQQQFARAVSG